MIHLLAIAAVLASPAPSPTPAVTPRASWQPAPQPPIPFDLIAAQAKYNADVQAVAIGNLLATLFAGVCAHDQGLAQPPIDPPKTWPGQPYPLKINCLRASYSVGADLKATRLTP